MLSLRDLNEGMGDCGSIPLVCPICRGELELGKAYRRLGRVRTGEIRCLEGCATFHIIYGIPIMLPPGRSATWRMPSWRPFLREHGKQKLMEAIAAGEFDGEKKVSGPPVAAKELRKVRRVMTKVGWQQYLKGCKTSSNEPDAVAIAERLSQIQSGVLVDFGCGGGFTTERVLQEIQPSACCVPIDIEFGGAKIAHRRAELLGKGDRCLGMCADLRQLPFADETIRTVYTRNGFNHIHHYFDALQEAYRATKKDGRLVAVDDKVSRWRGIPDFRGVNPEEQLEILRQLGLYVSGQVFVEDVKRVGFDVLKVDELQMPNKILVEAARV